MVRAYEAWKQAGRDNRPRLLIGARLVFRDGTPDILAYPKDRKAYGRLCRLISVGKLRAPKGECLLDLADLTGISRGLLLIVMPPADPASVKASSGSAWATTPGWRPPCFIPAKTAAACAI